MFTFNLFNEPSYFSGNDFHNDFIDVFANNNQPQLYCKADNAPMEQIRHWMPGHKHKTPFMVVVRCDSKTWMNYYEETKMPSDFNAKIMVPGDVVDDEHDIRYGPSML
jgi:hypothetical protein